MRNASRQKQNIFFIGLVVLFLIVLGLSAVIAFLTFRVPLARHLGLFQSTAAPTRVEPALVIEAVSTAEVVVATSTAESVEATSTTEGVEATSTPAPKQPAAAAQSGACGTGTMVLLFEGTGSATGMTSAEAIRLLKIDFTHSRVTSIAFPSDLWVKTSSLASLGIPENRLGATFHYAQNAAQGGFQDKSIAGTTAVAQALYDNFGVVPQFYINVSLAPWSEMIESVGGVDLILTDPFQMTDGTIIPAGKQRLTGKMTKEYISTFRSGEESRMQHQNQLVRALMSREMVLRILPKLPDLLNQFRDVIVTDLSPEQLLSLSCVADKVSLDETNFYEIGGDLVTARPDGALIPEVGKIEAFVMDALAK